MNRPTDIARQALAETRRALACVRDLIEDSDLLQRDVEDRVGFSRGYLSQLLNGHIDLKVRHLEPLLEALGLLPGQYFGALFPPGRRRVRRSGRPRPPLKVSKDVIRIYGFGIAEARELRRRLEQCEERLEEMARSDAVAALAAARRGDQAGG
ncbi:MAG TPA: helix-turn-helix transcriptional regulator [Thermoanaerobaculia bacterium]|jgi:transcriptional regulator with XRE-family HTH domain